MLWFRAPPFDFLLTAAARAAASTSAMEPISPAKDREDSIKLLIAAQAHLGTKNMDLAMSDYVWRRRA